MRKANQPSKDDLMSILDQIEDMAEDSLDPELLHRSRDRRHTQHLRSISEKTPVSPGCTPLVWSSAGAQSGAQTITA